MSSELRIPSSRANGAKPRGPKTALGKLRSSQNSRRHGMLSKTVVLENERPAAFSDLLAAFEAELQPANRVEKVCIDTIAVAHWRLMRLWGIQKAGLQSEMRRQTDEKHDKATSTAPSAPSATNPAPPISSIATKAATTASTPAPSNCSSTGKFRNEPNKPNANKHLTKRTNPVRTQNEPTRNPESCSVLLPCARLDAAAAIVRS
jgi:hypothetical protein